MFDPKQLDDIAHKLFAALPSSLQNFENEIQLKFKEIVQSACSRMDLVTREEFDVQCKVLARTREKLEAVQTQVDQLLLAKEAKNKEQ
jgi:ubiquinone biosynthesis accessory factor UbiK